MQIALLIDLVVWSLRYSAQTFRQGTYHFFLKLGRVMRRRCDVQTDHL